MCNHYVGVRSVASRANLICGPTAGDAKYPWQEVAVLGAEIVKRRVLGEFHACAVAYELVVGGLRALMPYNEPHE